MRAKRKLVVGGKDDQVLAGQRSLGMKAEQSVEYGERALRQAESRLRGADCAKERPLWTTLSSGRSLAIAWLATCASESDRRPKASL